MKAKLIAVLLVLSMGTPFQIAAHQAGWDLVPEILSKINPPTFPNVEYVITDYGAVEGGVVKNTDAIRNAINTCSNAGGGKVVIPAGTFLTGPIHLKSNVNLVISEGATLKFSTDPNDYLPVVLTRWEGVECYNYSPLIYTYGQKNVAITGKGTLDAQSDNTHWWHWTGKTKYGWSEGMPNQKADVALLYQMGEDGVPVEERIFGDGHLLRPAFIQFYKCKNVLLDGVTIKNSPFWVIHPVLSENVTIQNVTVNSHGPNNDGCDPDSCSHVQIKNCTFDTGDDCVAIKSGRNNDGRRVGVPCSNIVVQDCVMKEGHGGIVIGSEISGNANNIFAENCEFNSPDLERVLRIKTNTLRGGVVENIYLRNSIALRAKEGIRVNFFYYNETGPNLPVLRNVEVDNVKFLNVAKAFNLMGLAESKITNLTVKNSSFNGVTEADTINNVDNLRLINVTKNGEDISNVTDHPVSKEIGDNLAVGWQIPRGSQMMITGEYLSQWEKEMQFYPSAWIPDNGDGTYKNPVINADYSDPDVVRVGEEFFMVSSSFNCAPGLPILHSKDLVNWKIIGHVIDRQIPDEVYSIPQHGNGVWAPSIRHHNGEFYIYYGDPDFGIYMSKATNPAGPWEPLVLVKEALGWIDPCPLWDDDGNAYLVHAFANSRAGIKSVLMLNRMNTEGTKILDEGVIIFDGHETQPTIEGPKFYKRKGYYYIFAPAGGVKNGWQTVLRSKDIYGPYEERIVMEQGSTSINGPHQGGWVELENGESWFVHFQDKEPYGRVVHLNPIVWKNDWPVIGSDPDGDGIGEPVLTFTKPNVGKTYPIRIPETTDYFNKSDLGLQWQWHANPKADWISLTDNRGHLRLRAVELPDDFVSFWQVPNLLMQKFPNTTFTVTTKLTFKPKANNEKAGLIVMGDSYAYLSIASVDQQLYLSQTICKNARKGGTESESQRKALDHNTLYLRVKVSEGAICDFSYSVGGENFTPFGESFAGAEGRWIGIKIGLFTTRPQSSTSGGTTDFDWFVFE